MKRVAVRGLLVVFVLIGATAGHPQSAARSKPRDISHIQGKLSTNRQKQATLRRALRQTKSQVKNVRVDIGEVDRRLQGLERDLNQTQSDLRHGQSRQADLSRDLKDAQTQVAQTRERVRQRIRAMYMSGDSTFIGVLAGTQSVGDLAAKASILREIAAHDRQLFDRYVAESRRVAVSKQRQDANVAEIRRLKSRQTLTQYALSDARQEKTDALHHLKGKQQELESALREFQRDEDAMRSEIRAYYARYARKGTTAKPLPKFTGRFMQPVSGRLSSNYGNRYHPILKRWRLHAGVDIAAPNGAPIHAAADGVVISTGYGNGYGNRVIIDHGGGITTTYAHCSRIYARGGQRVSRGQTVAAVGSTGLATGPHCHFEVRVNGNPVNPMGWIR